MSSFFSTSPNHPTEPFSFRVATGTEGTPSSRCHLSPTTAAAPSDSFGVSGASDGFTVSADCQNYVVPTTHRPSSSATAAAAKDGSAYTADSRSTTLGYHQSSPSDTFAVSAGDASSDAYHAVVGGASSYPRDSAPPYTFAHGIVGTTATSSSAGANRTSRHSRGSHVVSPMEDGLGYRSSHTDPSRLSRVVNAPEYASSVVPSGPRGRMQSGGSNTNTISYLHHGYPAHSNQQRLHQDFKALSKEERKRLVEQEAAESDLLARTVHLRFLPTTMLQSDLAHICSECGPYLRVRICGNSTNNQNWIYGFVEFATREGAANMMKKCGMELSNGPGRPPLRLKCNGAKQPIVDRVFHDADPATNTPCIFGLGNFAHRSIKDALDSYFNLKEKEAALGAVQGNDLLPPPPPLPAPASAAAGSGFAYLAARAPRSLTTTPTTATMVPSTTPKLSPHAKAFHPNPDAAAFTPAGFTLGVPATPESRLDGCGGKDVAGDRSVTSSGFTGLPAAAMTAQQQLRLSAHVLLPSSTSSHTTPSTAGSELSKSSNNDNAYGGGKMHGSDAGSGTGASVIASLAKAPSQQHHGTRDLSAAFATPGTPFGDPSPVSTGSQQAYLQPPLFTVGYSTGTVGRQLSDWSVGGTAPTPTFTTAAVAPPCARNVASSASADIQQLGAGSNAGMRSDVSVGVFDPLLLASLMHSSDRSAVADDRSSYPVPTVSLDGFAEMPAGNSNTPGKTSATEAAANQLTQALQAMMENSDLHAQRCVVEAEEVVLRARSMLTTAIAQSRCYAESDARTGFFDAVGTLRSLLKLLEKHSALFESVTSSLSAQDTLSGAKDGGSGSDLYLATEGERGRRRLHRLAQWATQMRLVANLLSAMLYMRRRSFVDALPFIHAVVTVTNAIPSRPLGVQRASTRGQQSAAVGSAAAPPVAVAAEPPSPFGAPGTRNRERDTDTDAGMALALGARGTPVSTPVAPAGGAAMTVPSPTRFSSTDSPITSGAATAFGAHGGGDVHDSVFSFFDGASAELLKALLSPVTDDEEEVENAAATAIHTDNTWAEPHVTSDVALSVNYAKSRNNQNSNTATISPRSAQEAKTSASLMTGLRADSQRETPDVDRASTTSSGGSGNGGWAVRSNRENAAGNCVDSISGNYNAHFHCFVLNVLVTIGLALEEVQPVVTRSTYALAAGRARDVFGRRADALEACLKDDSEEDEDGDDEDTNARNLATETERSRDGPRRSRGEPRNRLLSSRLPRLAVELAKEVTRAGGVKDITTLPSAFLLSLPAIDEDRPVDDEAVWDALPPQHLVRLFPSW